MSLKYRYQNFQIREYEISLRLLRDMDQYSDPDKVAKKAGISQAAWPLFGMVWASSEVLAHLMLEFDIEGKRILDVGCGMALACHLLNARGADITAMDIHPIVGDFLRDNALLNQCPPIPFLNASWGDEIDAELGEFDLILGSDILYEPKHVKNLAPFIDRHARATSQVIIIDPDRGLGTGFYDAMIESGFSCEEFRPAISDHLGIEFTGLGYRYFR